MDWTLIVTGCTVQITDKMQILIWGVAFHNITILTRQAGSAAMLIIGRERGHNYMVTKIQHYSVIFDRYLNSLGIGMYLLQQN